MTSYIQLRSEGPIAPLDKSYVRSYLTAINKCINSDNINVDTLLENVYPKLKRVNTLDDINDQIIASASEMIIDHYEYQKIAVYLLIKTLHKTTESDYAKMVRLLFENVDGTGKPKPIVN